MHLRDLGRVNPGELILKVRAVDGARQEPLEDDVPRSTAALDLVLGGDLDPTP